jgi:hypothetical protein
MSKTPESKSNGLSGQEPLTTEPKMRWESERRMPAFYKAGEYEVKPFDPDQPVILPKKKPRPIDHSGALPSPDKSQKGNSK